MKKERSIFAPMYHVYEATKVIRKIRFELSDTNLSLKRPWQYKNLLDQLDSVNASLERAIMYSQEKDILGYGREVDEEDQSGFCYWVFKPGLTEEQITEILARCHVEVEGRPVDSPYDCTGKYFSRPIAIHRRRHKFGILVWQYWGYDC